jgi:hypothetical protein
MAKAELAATYQDSPSMRDLASVGRTPYRRAPHVPPAWEDHSTAHDPDRTWPSDAASQATVDPCQLLPGSSGVPHLLASVESFAVFARPGRVLCRIFTLGEQLLRLLGWVGWVLRLFGWGGLGCCGCSAGSGRVSYLLVGRVAAAVTCLGRAGWLLFVRVGVLSRPLVGAVDAGASGVVRPVPGCWLGREQGHYAKFCALGFVAAVGRAWPATRPVAA